MNKTVMTSIAAVLAALSIMVLAGCFDFSPVPEPFEHETAATAVPEVTETSAVTTTTTTEAPTTTAQTTTAVPVTTATTYTSRLATAIIIGDSVNLRSGPGTNYDVKGCVFRNESFLIESKALSERGVVWYRINAHGIHGYICASFVDTTGDLRSVPNDDELEETTAATKTSTTASAQNSTTAATQKPTTATQAPATQPTSATTASTQTSTTTETQKPTGATTEATQPTESQPPENWAAGTSGEVIAELRAYAASIGLNWETSLNAGNSSWASDTGLWTSAYESKSEYVTRMQQKLSYYKNSVSDYGYVNIYVTERDGDNYKLTCFFG